MEQHLFNELSPRECQVVKLIKKGLSNKCIAEQLFISERTVKFHCTNIFSKYQVANRLELLLKLMIYVQNCT